MFTMQGGIRRPAKRGRRAALAAVLVPSVLWPVLTLGAAASSASLASSGPTCSLDTSNIQIQTPTEPGAITLVAQDSLIGLHRQLDPYHVNSNSNIDKGFLGGTTAPVDTTFTQRESIYSSSGSLHVINVAKQSTVCLAQFKNLTNGGRAVTTGFAFPSDRNNLVIDNSSTAPLTAAYVQINSGCQFTIPLAPGEVSQTDMSDISGIDCLFGDTSGSTTLNTVTITGLEPQNWTVGAGQAEAVVWGVGPFVGAPLPN